ncbi:MAG: hypothetical protein AAF092_13620 [Pseudomonadota bacterium]
MSGRSFFRPERFALFTTALSALGLAVMVAASLSLTEGAFFYTLDDPYIHLALAESILEGGYGINDGEFASPSSSILYPWLMAGSLALGLGTLGPFIVAASFGLMGVWVVARFVARLLLDDDSVLAAVVFVAMAVGLLLVLSILILPLNGMEHTVHVFGTALALVGLYAVLVEEDRGSIWVVFVGVLICATIRFEGLVLAGGAIAVLAWARHWGAAAGLALLVAVALGVYAVTMSSMGLPFFPSSVMTKSNVAAEASEGSVFGLLAGILENFQSSIRSGRGLTMALAAAVLLAMCVDSRFSARERVFFGLVSAVLAGQVVGGQFNYYSRYEAYSVAAMVIGVVALMVAHGGRMAGLALGLALSMGIYAMPFGIMIAKTPAATANIYQQQYQMHRFTETFFPAPVAVNDLGWVAYQNDNYVLDLWGLGSEEARQLTAAGGWTAQKLDEITARHGIAYAMIYDDWFDDIPDTWCLAAYLITSHVTSASATVSFYLIDLDRVAEMDAALPKFAEALPDGARLETFACGPAS